MSNSNLSRYSSDKILTSKDSFWLLFPVAIALSYWVASYVFRADDPFYIDVILRNFGDYVFFWLIKALGQINLHPTFVFETPAGSLQPSPMLGIAPYAALYRIFGYWGFVVTDVVVLCANFLALVVLLRLGGARPISALLVAVGSVALMYVVPATHLTPNLPYAFGMRFPRPFVSQLFLIGCFCCLVVQMHVGVDSRRYVKLSAYYAISLALLIQIDTYTAAAAIVAFGLVLVWRIWCARGISLRQFAAISATGAITVILCIPFFIQILTDDGAMGARMGLFEPKHRLAIAGSYLTDKYTILLGGALVAISLVAAVLGRLVRPEDEGRERLMAGLGFAPIAGASTILAPAVFIVASPTLAELYHFSLMQTNIVILIALFVAGLGLTIIGARLRWDPASPGAGPRRGVKLSAVVLSIGAVAAAYAAMAWHVTHQKEVVDYFPPADPAHFRADMAQVLGVLRPLQRDPNTVLATNEGLVATWWVLERDGKILLPDPFATTVSTRELDRRFAYFQRVLGTSKAAFPGVVQSWAKMVYSELYEASPYRQFADMSDYTPEQQQAIRSTSWANSWQLIVPISEVKRLSALFEDDSLNYRVDIIVLQKSPDTASPTPDGFSRALDNSNFTVWVKRT